MALNLEPSSPDPLPIVPLYTRWPEIFRSWFWRFYDHLFFLLIYNFAWVLSCYGIGWILVHFGLVEVSKGINLIRFFQFYFLFLIESAVSIGWAFLVFKIFIEGQGGIADIWIGIRKYFWRGIGVSAVSGVLVCLVVYNLCFYFALASPNRFLTLLLSAFSFWVLLFWLSASLYQWPILFFQNPPFFKIFYRSFLVALSNALISLGLVFFFVTCLGFFLFVPFLLFFVGAVFFFSLQCVALEKNYLKYKITYDNKPLGPFLEHLESERQRGWREILKPWENR